jgi:hypothetical protein
MRRCPLPRLALLATLLLAAPHPFARAEPAPASGPAPAAPALPEEVADEQVGERLRFLHDRLEADRAHGQAWQRGWPALYAVGAVWSFSRAADTAVPSHRTDQLISGALSVVGIVDLLVPNFTHAQEGADELRGLPEGTPAERRAKLGRAEALLRRNAAESARRHDVLRHLFTVAVPLASGLFIGLYYDDWEQAALSTSVAIAVGEATIWTQPWAAADDLAEYERRFGGPVPAVSPASAGGPTWRLLPTPAGAWLLVEF